MKKKRAIVVGLAVLLSVGLAVMHPRGRAAAQWALARVTGGSSVQDRLRQYGPAARQRLRPHFAKAGVIYPPGEVVLVGIKSSRTLELWARASQDQPWRLITTCDILAASGTTGPKLREGDLQVPEGCYRIESLNPNSLFHLALRLDYPNKFDRGMAAADGRTKLGKDIMIHGGSSSVGCLAMGDAVAEELFTLVADTGLAGTRVILTPHDFRKDRQAPALPDSPRWVIELYQDLDRQLRELER